MSLYVCNHYPSRACVAVMCYFPRCGGGLQGNGNCWERQGWFSVVPGTCKRVLPNKSFPDVGDDLADLNRYYCIYALADDGAYWAGPYKRGVTNSKFARCDCIGYSN